MRSTFLMFIFAGLILGFHSSLHADEAGIGWDDGDDGSTAEEPASEDSAANADNWFGQLLELLVTEESE